MDSVEVSIYKGAYLIWNTLLKIATSFFTVNPMNANSSVSGVAESVYNVFLAIAVPLCTTFFFFGIVRDVIESPPEHQLRKLFSNGLKFVIIIALILNLWTIMKGVMTATTALTYSVASSVNVADDYIPSTPDSMNNMPGSIGEAWDQATDEVGWFNAVQVDMPSGLESVLNEVKNMGLDTEGLFCHILSFIMGIVTLFICVASGITLISCGVQRIIKPLIVLPFSSVAMATGSGSGEISRVMPQFLKSFLGLLLSGAMMIICVQMGSALSDKMIVFSEGFFDGQSAVFKLILLSIQSAASPIVITGCVKGVDALIGKFL